LTRFFWLIRRRSSRGPFQPRARRRLSRPHCLWPKVHYQVALYIIRQLQEPLGSLVVEKLVPKDAGDGWEICRSDLAERGGNRGEQDLSE